MTTALALRRNLSPSTEIADRHKAPRLTPESLRRSVESLTKSERDVLSLTAIGETDRSTAAKLGLCTRTVQLRRKSIRAKLPAKSRAELIRLAVLIRLAMATSSREGGAA